MNWLNTYRPTSIAEFKGNKLEIEKAINWINSFIKNPLQTKKVLFIIGSTGVGKTLLADIIFKEYNYQKIELNSTDVRSQKKLGEFLKKSLTYKNVLDMFHEGKLPIGILMDEIDTICKLSDKGGMNEFLDILKQNEKNEKSETSKKKSKKPKVNISDYIKIYNPIICTSNDINDKKLNELKKYSVVIKLEKPMIEDVDMIIDELYLKVGQKYDKDVVKLIDEFSAGDIRKLISILEDLHFYSNGETINIDMFNNFQKSFKRKEEDIQLIDSTKILLTKKLDICESQILFDIDCLLTPLMIYHNSINYIKNCEDSSLKKLNIYKNIMESLCIHDTIQTNIFEVQDWDELYNIASIYATSLPNYYFNQLKSKKDISIEFTSLLNKISQMYVNKKLLNSAKYSIGKLNYDNDEIIYITEIISEYFNIYKETVDTDDEGDCDYNDELDLNDIGCGNSNDADGDINNDLENKINIPLSNKKPVLENNSTLIKFMNKYSMNVDSLENILKIEKLNQINEKRKKKFTLKIKKDMANYLITPNF